MQRLCSSSHSKFGEYQHVEQLVALGCRCACDSMRCEKPLEGVGLQGSRGGDGDHLAAKLTKIRVFSFGRVEGVGRCGGGERGREGRKS